MNKAVPWSIKGVDFDAREAAKEAARRSGMTLGEWLNSVIADQAAELGVDVEDVDEVDRLEAVASRLARMSRGGDVPQRHRRYEEDAPAARPAKSRAARPRAPTYERDYDRDDRRDRDRDRDFDRDRDNERERPPRSSRDAHPIHSCQKDRILPALHQLKQIIAPRLNLIFGDNGRSLRSHHAALRNRSKKMEKVHGGDLGDISDSDRSKLPKGEGIKNCPWIKAEARGLVECIGP